MRKCVFGSLWPGCRHKPARADNETSYSLEISALESRDSWGKTIDLYCYIKVLKVKPVYQQMTLSPKLGAVGISTLWHFRLPLPIQMFIKVASSPRLSGIGMPSPILWSHPLKMQRIVLLNSLLWWELGTNSLITGPGEWLSFRRFTSKLSWSWSWSVTEILDHPTYLSNAPRITTIIPMAVSIISIQQHSLVTFFLLNTTRRIWNCMSQMSYFWRIIYVYFISIILLNPFAGM